MKKIEKIIALLKTKSFPYLLDAYAGEIRNLTREIRERVIYIQGHDFFYIEDEKIAFQTRCVTSAFGYGFTPGSFATPTGLHRVSECIGDGASMYQKFVKRQPTVIETPVVENELKPGVYGRILRLDGMQEDNKSTHSRGVYIHGNIHDWYWQSGNLKRSKGCIGLRLNEMKDIYDAISQTSKRVFVYIEGNQEKIGQV